MVGPVPGKKYSEITFPILSPDPATKKDVHFLKYPIYIGGNRGRGQIYPNCFFMLIYLLWGVNQALPMYTRPVSVEILEYISYHWGT